MPVATANTAALECQMAQTEFLQRGGTLQRPLLNKYKTGELVPPHAYEFQEFPKALNLPLGSREIQRSTEDVKGRELRWTETKAFICMMVVQNETEEAEARELFAEAMDLGVDVGEEWDLDLLRRETKQARGRPRVTVVERAPPASVQPVDDEESRLAAELDALRRRKAMREEIAALRAELDEADDSDEAEDMRVQLRGFGVKVDGRWGIDRLRQELEAATAPA